MSRVELAEGGSGKHKQKPEPMTKVDLRELLHMFSASVDELIELHEAQKKSKESLTKKLKESTSKKWKREGNKRQYKFNQQVLDKCFINFINFINSIFLSNASS